MKCLLTLLFLLSPIAGLYAVDYQELGTIALRMVQMSGNPDLEQANRESLLSEELYQRFTSGEEQGLGIGNLGDLESDPQATWSVVKHKLANDEEPTTIHLKGGKQVLKIPVKRQADGWVFDVGELVAYEVSD